MVGWIGIGHRSIEAVGIACLIFGGSICLHDMERFEHISLAMVKETIQIQNRTPDRQLMLFIESALDKTLARENKKFNATH